MNIPNIIQDMWLIEEKAKSLRNSIWLTPPSAPTTADRTLLTKIKVLFPLITQYDNKYIGAIFWTVIKITHWTQDKPSITWGNQKCTGAAPNFNNNDIHNMCIKLKEIKINTEPNTIKAEPKAWIKKYFKEASEAYWLLFTPIKGIKDIRFSSRPHQAPNQESEEILKTVPITKVKKNKSFL